MICDKCNRNKEMSITEAYESMNFTGKKIKMYRCTSCGASVEIGEENGIS